MPPIAASVRLSIVALLVLSAACKPTARGGPVDHKAEVAADQAKRGITQRRAASAARMFAPTLAPESGPRVIKSELPFERKTGYLVRGTDILLFLPCGDKEDYFMVAPPPVLGRVRQFYRFATRRPYVPVYMNLNARLLHDTVTVGQVTFKRIVDVKDFSGDSLGTPKCGRPVPGEVMDRLRKYEPNM